MDSNELQSRDIANLNKDFSRLEKKVDDGFRDINKKLDLLQNYMTRFEIMAEIDKKADIKDVESLEANQSKIVWIVITAVMVALLALILK